MTESTSDNLSNLLHETRTFPPTLPAVPATGAHDRDILAEAAIQARVYKLLNAYRVRGHLFAHVDPLAVYDLPSRYTP